MQMSLQRFLLKNTTHRVITSDVSLPIFLQLELRNQRRKSKLCRTRFTKVPKCTYGNSKVHML